MPVAAVIGKARPMPRIASTIVLRESVCQVFELVSFQWVVEWKVWNGWFEVCDGEALSGVLQFGVIVQLEGVDHES